MKKLALFLGAAAAVVLLLSSVVPTEVAATPVVQEGSGSADAGQAIFMDQKCNMCHAVSTAGIEAKTKSAKMAGPDMAEVDRDLEFVMKYLKKEEAIEGEKHRKAFSGSDEELKVLAQWILDQ